MSSVHRQRKSGLHMAFLVMTDILEERSFSSPMTKEVWNWQAMLSKYYPMILALGVAGSHEPQKAGGAGCGRSAEGVKRWAELNRFSL